MSLIDTFILTFKVLFYIFCFVGPSVCILFCSILIKEIEGIKKIIPILGIYIFLSLLFFTVTNEPRLQNWVRGGLATLEAP